MWLLRRRGERLSINSTWRQSRRAVETTVSPDYARGITRTIMAHSSSTPMVTTSRLFVIIRKRNLPLGFLQTDRDCLRTVRRRNGRWPTSSCRPCPVTAAIRSRVPTARLAPSSRVPGDQCPSPRWPSSSSWKSWSPPRLKVGSTHAKLAASLVRPLPLYDAILG